MHLTIAGFVAFAGSTCGVLGFWSYLRIFLKKAHDHTVQATAIATAKQLAGQIDERTKQLEHNGGSSLRDDVTAIRDAQGELRRTITTQADKLDAQGDKLDAQGQQLAALVETVHAINGRLDTLTTKREA